MGDCDTVEITKYAEHIACTQLSPACMKLVSYVRCHTCSPGKLGWISASSEACRDLFSKDTAAPPVIYVYVQLDACKCVFKIALANKGDDAQNLQDAQSKIPSNERAIVNM